MDCEWRSKLDQFVDAELPAPEAQQMQSHVQACPTCASEALSRLQMKRAVHSGADSKFMPGAQFRLRLEALTSTRKPKRKWLSFPQLAFASASIAALTAIVVVLWFYRAVRPDVAGELADLHVATLASANPVDVVSTDRHTVKPWFAGKLPFTFNLPDFENTPFRLVGGRVAYLNQSAGAQLLFTIRKHQISVFIFQDRNGLSRLASSLSSRKSQFNIESWAEGGLRYFIISDASPDDLRKLANLLKSAA